MSKVSLVKSPTHQKGVLNCLENLKEDLQKKLSEVNEIVIKINFVNAYKELATTPFESVKYFVEFILPFYKGKIIIAEIATFGDTDRGFKKYGFAKLAEDHPQVSLLNLKNDESLYFDIPYPEGEMKFPLSKKMVKTPFLVSITRPKTHDTVVATLGIKNVLVGVINGPLNVRRHIHQGMAIHDLMVGIASHAYPDFVLLDGTISMEKNGPASGTPKKADWTLASFDALAADSLASYLMGFDINDIGYFNMLHEKGFGKLYPKDKIEIIGENEKDLVDPFIPHSSFENQKLWRK